MKVLIASILMAALGLAMFGFSRLASDDEVDAVATSNPIDVAFTMKGDEPRAEIQRRLGECPEGTEHIGHQAVFDGLVDWIEIDHSTDLSKVERRSTGFRSDILVLVGSSKVGLQRDKALEVTIHPDLELGIDWGLREARSVYLGVDRTSVAWVVLTELNTGEPVFVGECAEAAFARPLEATFGALYADMIPDLVTKAGVELVEYALPATVSAGSQIPPLLNPQSSDAAVLSSLRSVAVFLRLNDELPGHIICSRIVEGWNDCVPVEGAIVDQGGDWLEQYVGADGTLDFYLIGPDGNLLEPIQSLGKVTVPNAMIGGNSPIAVEVEFKRQEGSSVGGTFQVELTDTSSKDVNELLADVDWAFNLPAGEQVATR